LYELLTFHLCVQEHDIAIPGSGTLDSQADEMHWWNWRIIQPYLCWHIRLRDAAARVSIIRKHGRFNGSPVKTYPGPGSSNPTRDRVPAASFFLENDARKRNDILSSERVLRIFSSPKN
jgi:hypothetical protein